MKYTHNWINYYGKRYRFSTLTWDNQGPYFYFHLQSIPFKPLEFYTWEEFGEAIAISTTFYYSVVDYITCRNI